MQDNSAHGYSEGSEYNFSSKEKLCRKSLQALYLEVPELIAEDIDNNVSAFVHEIKAELKRKDSEIQQLKEALGWMVPIAEKHLNCIGDMDADYGGYEFEIEVSRKLLIVLNKPEK